jgi:glycosyltransferase 2 family protein
MRRLLLIVGSILVSAFFLWFILRDFPLSDIWARIQQADPFLILVSLAIAIFGLWLRAVRWQAMLDNRPIPLRVASYIMGITFLLNLLPLRAGELARSVLARRYGVPIMTAATSIVLERLVDVLMVVVLLAIALTQAPSIPPEMARVATLFGVVAVVGFIVLIVLARSPEQAFAGLQRVEAMIPALKRLPLESTFRNVLAGLAPLTHVRGLVNVFGWSIAGWAASILSLLPLFAALHIEGINIVVCAVIAVCMASFSIAIPVSVAAIGPFEAAVLAAGQLAGLDGVQALSLGFLFHGVSVADYIIWGIIGFLGLGLSPRKVMESSDAGIAPETATTMAPGGSS